MSATIDPHDLASALFDRIKEFYAERGVPVVTDEHSSDVMAALAIALGSLVITCGMPEPYAHKALHDTLATLRATERHIAAMGGMHRPQGALN